MDQRPTNIISPDTAIAVTAAGAYTAGDSIGGLITFSMNSVTGSGLITTLYFEDADNEKGAFDVWIFNALPQTVANDAAFASAITIATLKKRIAVKSIAAADWTTINSLAYVTVDLSTTLTPAAYRPFTTDNDKLYVYLVATGTPTYTNATDLTMRMGVLLD